MKKRLCIFISLLISVAATAQQPVRRLPSIINHPSLNVVAPYMSADGNAILFIADSGQDGELLVSYASRELDWSAPAELPKHINNRLNFTRGYALSAYGKKIFFTSAKSPVIGGYDIFVSELRGSVWTNPENMMLPINSRENEACPSITPDGSAIYFMRCDKMNTNKAEGCKIFRALKKQNGQWDEPKALPDFINTGNSQTPRILADNETLIFSSDKMPGNKGGMDLYLSRQVNGVWSQPIPLDFINSDRDDQYVSVNALGRYILKEAKGARNNWELTEFLIPADLRPKGLMKIEGKVNSESGGPVPAYISVVDLNTGKRTHSLRPAADGSFFLYLKEGTTYELSVDPENGEHTFYAKMFDLTGDKIAQKEKINAVLTTLKPGDEISLPLVRFKDYSAELSRESEHELKRLSRLVKSNPQLTFEVQVLLEGYRESFAPEEGLTEKIESEEQLISGDSAEVAADTTFVRRVLYNNNRTTSQAEAIVNYLVADGVKREQLTQFVNAREGLEGQEVLTVRVRALKAKY